MKAVVIAGVVASAIAIPALAFAHSFQLGVIVPAPESGNASRQAALDGLRLATRERDGHPDETSDGHLGGLDSHLRPLDAGAPADLPRLRRQVGEMRLDIVTAAVPARDIPALAAALEGTSAAFCPPAAGPVPPDELDGAEAEAFVAAFVAEFGYRPPAEAARGYNAGRAVDSAVRTLGDVSDRAALSRLCSGEN